MSTVAYILIVIGVILLILGVVPTPSPYRGPATFGPGIALLVIGIVLLFLPVP